MRDAPVFPAGRVTLVGVLNVTPDSFSDGGALLGASGRVDLERVLAQARALVAAGAHVLDVGGESTRPGAAAVAAEDEIERTQPVIEALAKRFATPLSIDTRRARVAEAALEVGASVVNDVSGGRHDPALLEVAARRGATLIVGHLPYLGRLASLLLASDPDRPLLAFQPGSMACLEKTRRVGGCWPGCFGRSC